MATTHVAAAQRYGDGPRRPFVAGAVSAGAVGFADAGVPTASLIGAYGYAGLTRMMVGVQGGGSASGPARMHYAMATLAWPAHARRRSQIYPFVGVGAGTLPSSRLSATTGMLFGAGVGVDRILGKSDHGMMAGMRAGYLDRSGDNLERAVYLGLSVGGVTQLRREQRIPPPVIVAAR